MERYTRCGDESAFYHEHEMASEVEASFVSPLGATLSVALHGDEQDHKDPIFDGAIRITADYLDLAQMAEESKKSGKRPWTDDEFEAWGNKLLDLIEQYGIDPVVITSEFENSFSDEAKDGILERIGLMMSIGSFAKNAEKDKEIFKQLRSETITFVTEGSPAQQTYTKAKERVEREGIENLERRWHAIVAREINRPRAVRVFTAEDLQLRDDLRAYSELEDIKIVPNARQSVQEYLTKIGAFECARIIP